MTLGKSLLSDLPAWGTTFLAGLLGGPEPREKSRPEGRRRPPQARSPSPEDPGGCPCQSLKLQVPRSSNKQWQ